ncbi:hypothetical protein SBRCBS47491_008634 [Sporothrix bragantina]|uniref:gamma-glutamylcyclotransferase n=1 Tax=Sporothrix bragantina TaxID=671064 RepID=A0ABP0CNV1_9PEZI
MTDAAPSMALAAPPPPPTTAPLIPPSQPPPYPSSSSYPPSSASPTSAPPRATRTLYFAYGSDMQLAYMARTCPNSRYIGRGVLTDYKWHINRLGFANLVKVKTAHAPGLVFELDDDDRQSLEAKRFPLYKSVTVDAELHPAPFCLYRRQATWIVKHGGPEAVLEEAYSKGNGNDARSSYTERNLLVFISIDVTTDGRPDARYAEAINAAAADAMALGIDAVFFEKIVQQFMPGRLLPHLRVVRRGKSTSPSPDAERDSSGRGTSPGTSPGRTPGRSTGGVAAASRIANMSTTSIVGPGGIDDYGLKPSRKRTIPAVVVSQDAGSGSSSAATMARNRTISELAMRAAQMQKQQERAEKAEKAVKADKSGKTDKSEKSEKSEKSDKSEKSERKAAGTTSFGDTLRTMFTRHRPSPASKTAGRYSPVYTDGDSTGDADGDESSNGEGTSSAAASAAAATASRQTNWSRQATSAASAAMQARVASGSGFSSSRPGLDRRHSKSASDSNVNLVGERGTTNTLAPTITISRPSSALAKQRAQTMQIASSEGSASDDNDNDSDASVATGPETTAAVVSPRPWRSITDQQPPPRPDKVRIVPPPIVRPPGPSPLSSRGDLRGEGSSAASSAGEEVVPSKTGTVRRDTSGWNQRGNGESSGRASAQDSDNDSDDFDEKVAARTRPFKMKKKGPTLGRVAERKPVMRKRVTLEQAARALEVGSAEESDEKEGEEDEAKSAEEPSKSAPAVPAVDKARPDSFVLPKDKAAPSSASAPPQPKPVSRVASQAVPRIVPRTTPPFKTVPRQPFMLHARQHHRKPQTVHAANELRRRKSFCGGSPPVSRFDRFLQQAAEHPHFCEKPWLPAFRSRGTFGHHGHHGYHGYQGHTGFSNKYHVVFAQTTVVSVQERSRRMSF